MSFDKPLISHKYHTTEFHHTYVSNTYYSSLHPIGEEEKKLTSLEDPIIELLGVVKVTLARLEIFPTLFSI